MEQAQFIYFFCTLRDSKTCQGHTQNSLDPPWYIDILNVGIRGCGINLDSKLQFYLLTYSVMPFIMLVYCKNSLCRKETFADLAGYLMKEDTPLTQKRVSVYLLSVLIANNSKRKSPWVT